MRLRQRSCPTLDVDLYSDAALENPLSVYRAVRDAGPAVWLPKHRLWAVGRHRDVKAVLKNAEAFASGDGVAANPLANALGRGTVLSSDGEAHAARRRVMLAYLGPRRLDDVAATISERAEVVVDRLADGRWFDGVSDFAAALPVEVVADLVGVRVGPDQLLTWGRRMFDALGPANRRGIAATPAGLGLRRYTGRLGPTRVVPGSWAAGVFDAAARGEISEAEARTMVIDFVVPSLDTTILATAELLWRLGSTPGLWDSVRADAGLVPAAVTEAVRLASPVRGFTRRVLSDTDIDGVTVPAGSRVVVLYASANHDERAFPDPERFDLTRRPADQVGWGHGPHACVGMHLSKLEMQALLQAMASRVRTVQVGTPVTLRNNVLAGFTSVPARFAAAAPGASDTDARTV